MQIVAFRPAHLQGMAIQRAQVSAHVATPEEHANAGPGITGMIDGIPIFCAGYQTIWAGRHFLWSVLSAVACRHMLAITRALRFYLECGVVQGRLEVIVQSDFVAGHRWMRLLGFRLHHHEEMFLPDGGDADIYVRFT